MAKYKSRNSSRKEKSLLLILSEDAGGAYIYLEQTYRSRKSDKISIKTLGMGCEPRALLRHAKAALSGGSRRVPKADFVFLVFDRDSHEHFADTVIQVRSEDRILAFVNIPCIEFFFLLHAEMTTTSLPSAEAAIKRLKTHLLFTDYEKKRGTVRVAELFERSQIAHQNAANVRDSGLKNGADNPYTDMDIFAEFVEVAKRDGLENLIGRKDERLYLSRKL